MKKINKIPKFKSIKEEANFWDTRSFAYYWDNLNETKLKYASAKEKEESLVLRLDSKTKKAPVPNQKD